MHRMVRMVPSWDDGINEGAPLWQAEDRLTSSPRKTRKWDRSTQAIMWPGCKSRQVQSVDSVFYHLFWYSTKGQEGDSLAGSTMSLHVKFKCTLHATVDGFITLTVHVARYITITYSKSLFSSPKSKKNWNKCGLTQCHGSFVPGIMGDNELHSDSSKWRQFSKELGGRYSLSP